LRRRMETTVFNQVAEFRVAARSRGTVVVG
jgi:hypothetical protein